jgi:hypothetical protein
VDGNFTNAVYNGTMLGGSELCVNFTGAFQRSLLVLASVPDDTEVMYYRQKVASIPDLVHDFTFTGTAPFAVPSRQADDAFTIRGESEGTYRIGVLSAAPCRSGIFVVSTVNGSLRFGTGELQPHGLPLGTDKCVLIVNDGRTTVNLEWDLNPDEDVLEVYSGSALTSLFGANGTVLRTDDPILLRMHISSEMLCFRRVDLAIQTTTSGTPERSVFLGPYGELFPVNRSESASDATATLVAGSAEPIYKGGLGVISGLFIIVLVVSCFRYHWVAAFSGKCGQQDDKSAVTPQWSSRSATQRATLVEARAAAAGTGGS